MPTILFLQISAELRCRSRLDQVPGNSSSRLETINIQTINFARDFCIGILVLLLIKFQCSCEKVLFSDFALYMLDTRYFGAVTRRIHFCLIWCKNHQNWTRCAKVNAKSLPPLCYVRHCIISFDHDYIIYIIILWSIDHILYLTILLMCYNITSFYHILCSINNWQHNIIYQPVKNSRGNRFGAYAFGNWLATSSYILKRSSVVATTLVNINSKQNIDTIDCDVYIRNVCFTMHQLQQQIWLQWELHKQNN